MHLAYLDESYSESHYWIAAVVCPQHQVVALTAALDLVVAEAADGLIGFDPRAELHGYELFHAKGPWSKLSDPTRRIATYSKALSAVVDHGGKIIIRGIDVELQNERYVRPFHPHTVVLAHLLEQIDIHAESVNDLAIVIADEVDDPTKHRQSLWHFQREATPGYRSRKLTRIVDTMHFVPSSASRPVQASDLIAYLWRRRHARIENDDRAKRANDELWEVVGPNVIHSWCWEPHPVYW